MISFYQHSWHHDQHCYSSSSLLQLVHGSPHCSPSLRIGDRDHKSPDTCPPRRSCSYCPCIRRTWMFCRSLIQDQNTNEWRLHYRLLAKNQYEHTLRLQGQPNLLQQTRIICKSLRLVWGCIDTACWVVSVQSLLDCPREQPPSLLRPCPHHRSNCPSPRGNDFEPRKLDL